VETVWEIERPGRAEAANYSVGYSDAEDTWHPPTARVCEAAWWAALMATYAGAAVDMPPDIWEVWLWFEGGHWAAGVADLQAPELSALIML